MPWRLPWSEGRILLALGIALRILVFPFLGPLDADYGHLVLVKYVAEHHALFPLSADRLAFHPPLYYILAAPFYAVTGTAKGAQFLSLLLSILTLLVVYRLLYVRNLIERESARTYAFLLPCFLPQFVLYTLYVSNDTLTIFLGAVLALQVVRFVAAPNNNQLLLLILVEALGLLTKATFLAFLPGLFALVVLVRLRQGRAVWNAALVGFGVLVLSCALGSYKYIENYREKGTPFYSSMDQPLDWQDQQKHSYRGAASFFDVNIVKLIKAPSWSPVTEGAYPLVLYGTFWYQYFPESNLEGSRHPPYYYLGSAIYFFALLPSALILLGLFGLLKDSVRLIPGAAGYRLEDASLLCSLTCIAFLLGNVILVLAATMKYHLWSLMVGRYFFPSLCGLLVAFGHGVDTFAGEKIFDGTLKVVMISLVACFGLYFATEIAYQILHGLTPGASSFFKKLI